MRRARWMGCAIAALGLLAAAPAVPPLGGAVPAAAAEEAVLKVELPDPGAAAVSFTRDQIAALARQTIRTRTPWTEGVIEFEGVLLRDVLAAAKATGETIKVTAANDYSYSIPVADAMAYPVILAYSMNGQELSLRDKGPLWVVYPRDDFPELDSKETDHKMVWQVIALAVR